MHQPVLIEEVLTYLNPKPGDVVVDATIGSGGHARAIVERVGPSGIVIGIDQDPEAIRRSSEWARGKDNVLIFHSNFKEFSGIVEQADVKRIDGVLFDLGVSSDQLASPERGMSFLHDGPLDMRMDPDGPVRAADLVNRLPEKEIARIFFEFGEERRARRIAREIVKRRARRRFHGTADLAEVVASCIPPVRTRIHPATRVFQALRIAVNRELECLGEALDAVLACPLFVGRMVVISFHSLEDRIVKGRFKAGQAAGRLRRIAGKIVRPGREEIASNPRSRSAKLRAVEASGVLLSEDHDKAYEI